MGPMCLSLLCLVVLLTVLALISTEWVTARSMHSSKSSEIRCYHSRVDSPTSRPSVKPWVWSPPQLPVFNRPSMPSLPRWRCLQQRNRTSAPLQKTSTLSLHACSVSARLVFETRPKCQDFVARNKDDGIPYEINRRFCCAKTTITARQSKSPEDREIGKQFTSLWRALADQLEILFPDRDDEGAFVIPALDTRSQLLSIKDRRNKVGKPVFKLAPFGSGQLFALVAPVFLVFPVKCCNGSSLKPIRPLSGPSPLRFFAAWRVEAPFSAVSRFDGFYILRYL